MSNQSHYEFNVAKRAPRSSWNNHPVYEHLFATSPRSCVTTTDAAKVHAELIAKFPAPEYNVSCTYWDCVGKPTPFGHTSEKAAQS